jgi:hypothetical protein
VSHGRCEHCKKTASCRDCKDYNFREDVETVDNTLPSFPVDEATLAAVEHALQGSWTVDKDGNHTLVGAEFTLQRVLDLAAGINRNDDFEHLHPVSDRVYVDDRVQYTPNDIISALITETRRLREHSKMVLGHFQERGHPGRPCVRTGWIAEESVDQWRQEVGG